MTRVYIIPGETRRVHNGEIMRYKESDLIKETEQEERNIYNNYNISKEKLEKISQDKFHKL
jgi:hypothetical protein